VSGERGVAPVACGAVSTASELIARRELLWNLTLRELRGRYKRSILGWGWSLLNPIAFMLIYTFAFSLVLKANPEPGDPSGLASYAFYLLCGLLPWSFFSVSVTTSMMAVVGNGPLVRKVAFPREHLVVSTVFAGLFTLGIELLVLSVALAIVGNLVLVWVPMIALTSLLLAMFATGFGLALAAGYVYFRDLSYLWSIVVQGWFFATPIVYPAYLVQNRLDRWQVRVYDNIPMAVAVRIYRNLMYDLRMPRLIDFGLLAGYAVVALLAGWWIFDRLSGRFAEEL
jgi:ABC-type polysaccharide/polyol phosphate export permease